MIDRDGISEFTKNMKMLLDERKRKLEEVADEEINAALADDDSQEELHPLFNRIAVNEQDFYVLLFMSSNVCCSISKHA